MSARLDNIRGNSPRRARGFSLAELILVIVITGIVFALGGTLLGEGFRAYFTANDIVDSDWQGRLALARISRDLRTIRSAADIITMNPGQLVFTDREGNNVNITLTGPSLTRNGIPVADAIGALTFSYLRTDAITAAALPAEVAYIGLALTVTAGGANYALRTTVAPRNLW